MMSFRLALMAAAVCGLANAAAAKCGHFHVVAEGETLPMIAGANLGSVFKAETLAQQNAMSLRAFGASLEPGMILDLPCARDAADAVSLAETVEPQQLWQIVQDIDDVQVLDIRSLKALSEGVLPKTIAVPYEFWKAPKGAAGAMRAEQHIANIIGGAGLRLDRPIAILHSDSTPQDAGRAVFVSWLLKSAGADQLAILRGGYAAWMTAQLPISMSTASAEPYTLNVTLSANWRNDEGSHFGVRAN